MITSNDKAWTLNSAVGELRYGPLSGRVDVSRPDSGLRQIQLDGRDLPGHLLAVQRYAEKGSHEANSEWPLAIADAYVRGIDLVARYQPADDWPYAPQIYWRADPGVEAQGIVGSLSLLVSVQTHLLDTWPRIGISSQLACNEILYVTSSGGAAEGAESVHNRTFRPPTGVACILRRLNDVPMSYAEMMPATDFRELTLRRDSQSICHAEWELFGDFLEKGVIRRARLQTAFLSQPNDVQLALASCAAMEQRPLPLTT